MKTRSPLCLFIMLLIFSACNNDKDTKITIATISDTLETEDTVNLPPPASVKSDDYYDNFENPWDTLIGNWAAIREGNLTITFYKDSTFEFYDYNSKIKEIELLTGQFTLTDNAIILYYNDRPKQKFSFKKDPERNNEYRITNSGGYYFVKTD